MGRGWVTRAGDTAASRQLVNLNAFCPALLGTGGAARASVILVLYWLNVGY